MLSHNMFPFVITCAVFRALFCLHKTVATCTEHADNVSDVPPCSIDDLAMSVTTWCGASRRIRWQIVPIAIAVTAVMRCHHLVREQRKA
jgi:hypothetical protein